MGQQFQRLQRELAEERAKAFEYSGKTVTMLETQASQQASQQESLVMTTEKMASLERQIGQLTTNLNAMQGQLAQVNNNERGRQPGGDDVLRQNEEALRRHDETLRRELSQEIRA